MPSPLRLDAGPSAGAAPRVRARERPPAPRRDRPAPAKALRRRLVVAVNLFMPLCDASVVLSVLPRVRFPGWQWLLVALAAPLVTWAAWPFYAAAWAAARRRTCTMDTLVSLGVVSSTAWSLYAMFFEDARPVGRSALWLLAHRSGGSIYLDVAGGVITFLLAGRYLEARARERGGDVLRALEARAASEATVLDRSDAERSLPAGDLRRGERFVARAGGVLPADGTVVDGRCLVDRSLLTGESEPVTVEPGDLVCGGTVCLDGRAVVEATAVGGDARLGRMLALAARAEEARDGAPRFADRISAVAVPAVVGLALATLAGWFAAGAGVFVACNAALSVLVIACPCAIGLATPAATYVASGRGVRLGVFFRRLERLEGTRRFDTVVLDKTGTLTEGRLRVVDLACSGSLSRGELLAWAASLEAASDHPIARAIVAAAEGPGVAPGGAITASALGVQGEVDGHHLSVGMEAPEAAGLPAELDARRAAWADAGRTVVAVRLDGAVVGLLALADAVRPSAAGAVARLAALGVRCVVVSGDHERTVRAIAREVGVDEVVAGAQADAKVLTVRDLQRRGHVVAVVGDGANDAPALATADLGVAVGSAADVALAAADAIAGGDGLEAVAPAIALVDATRRTVWGNVRWAFAYNLVAIPVAACGLLDPLIAAGAMALSSGFVVWNSARLKARPSPSRSSAGSRAAGVGGELVAAG